MKQISDDISTTEKLYLKLHTVLTERFPLFIETTNARRFDVRSHIRLAIISGLFVFAIAAFLYVTRVDLNTLFGKIIALTFLLWVSVLVMSVKSWFIGTTLLKKEINMALVPIFSDVFNRTLLYTYNKNEVAVVTQLLKDSQLLIDEGVNLQVKSKYTIYSDTDMRVHEINFDQKTNSQVGKRDKAHAIFIDVNMPDEQAAATILTTAGTNFGFSQQVFVQHLLNIKAFESIEADEEHIKAFSTNPAVGSAFLNPSLLQTVKEWSQDAKVNIRVMRKESKLYILVPASDERTTFTSTSTEPEAIEQYAQVIVQPIWRAVKLSQEVRTE